VMQDMTPPETAVITSAVQGGQPDQSRAAGSRCPEQYPVLWLQCGWRQYMVCTAEMG